MFNTQSTTDRTDNNSFVSNKGATAMLNMSISVNNRIRTLTVAIAVIAVALFSTATSASAFVGFTPDGVNWIPAPDSVRVAHFTPDGVNQIESVDGPTIVRAQVLAYMNGGNHSPDGVSNITAQGETSNVIARFTPDGVNQVENVGSPAIARPQVLAYMNGGNHSPDGVSNLNSNGGSDVHIARFTPDGVNQVENVGSPAIARPQVLAYMNGGNHTANGVNNITAAGESSSVIAHFTPDGVNQVENVDGPIVVRAQVLAYMNGGNYSPDGVSVIGNPARDSSDITNLAYYYAATSDPSYVG